MSEAWSGLSFACRLALLATLPINACLAGEVPQTAPRKASLTGAVQKRGTGKTPRYHVNFQPAARKPSDNSFQDISQSMPAAAVKEELARKHELPSAQTAVLRPGASIGGAALNGARAPSPAASGASPEVLSPGKVAVPESKGAAGSVPFFK